MSLAQYVDEPSRKPVAVSSASAPISQTIDCRIDDSATGASTPIPNAESEYSALSTESSSLRGNDGLLYNDSKVGEIYRSMTQRKGW